MKTLVIEDSQDSAEMLCHALSLKGHECVSVGDSAEGVARAAEGDFDLIVLDLMMPGMNGLTAAGEIRKRDRLVGLLMVTGRDREAILEGAALRLGMKVLYKPLELPALYAAVECLTNGRGRPPARG